MAEGKTNVKLKERSFSVSTTLIFMLDINIPKESLTKVKSTLNPELQN